MAKRSVCDLGPLAVVALLVGCGGEVRPSAAPVARPAPAFEIDHLWIASAPHAPERVALERAGFQIAAKVNRHEGQGTSSVTVELDNGFIELIYPDEAVPVAPGREIVKAKFENRSAWRTSGHSPFGIAVRRLASAPAAFPFPTYKVTAAWLPAGTFMELLTPREMTGAISLFVPATPSVGPGSDPVDAAARVHANGAHRIAAVRVVAPSAEGLPPAARYLAAHGVGTFEVGGAWLLEVTLDDGAQGIVRDLRPALPVVIRY